MWHALVWAVTAACAAGWSLLCWALHQLVTRPDWQALGEGAWLQWLLQWRVPAGLADWLPLGAIGELQAWLATAGPWLERLLSHAPGLLDWLAPLVWVGWVLGLVMLVMLGLAGSVLVAAIRGAMGGAGGSAAAAAQAKTR